MKILTSIGAFFREVTGEATEVIKSLFALPSRNPRTKIYVPRYHDSDNRTCIAVHEAGHTVVGWRSDCVRKINKVVIFGEGRGLQGGVYYRKPVDPSPEDCWELASICLAGLAGESVAYGFFSIFGSNGDLLQAYAAAEKIATQEGLTGHPYPPPWKEEPLSGEARNFADICYRPEIAPRVVEILNAAYQRAHSVLREERRRLDEIAIAVNKSGVLDTENVYAILGERPK